MNPLTSDSVVKTPAQVECESTGHDFKWYEPEHDIGFYGYGECEHCGWTVPYEEPDLEDDYGC